MRLRCTLCSTHFEVSIQERMTALAECPSCGFVGVVQSDGRIEIPTFEEELSLPRFVGHIADEPGAETFLDITVVDQVTASDEPLPKSRRYWLTVLNGVRTGEIEPLLRRRTILGRTDADVNIDDSLASRKHCAIEILSLDNVFVRDLASTNGTKLNGSAITAKRLRKGDRLAIGATELSFSWEDRHH